MILTAKQGRNADLFPDILSLYVPLGSKIADVTYGKGNFWTKVDVSQYEMLPSDLSTGTDCRKLPYEAESIDVVVFDPPYIYNPKATIKDSISGSYALNETLDLRTNNDVLEFYQVGMTEAVRVLKKNGVLIVKCQDCIESNKSKWNHITIYMQALELGLVADDLFVLVQTGVPASRWKVQHHARKNHSYFWIFKKG